MQLKDLKKGVYYKNVWKDPDMNKVYTWIFKFDDLYKDQIFTFGFLIVDNKYKEIEKTIISLPTDIYIEMKIEEVFHLLPETHPDRINYLRRTKIKYLLNENN